MTSICLPQSIYSAISYSTMNSQPNYTRPPPFARPPSTEQNTPNPRPPVYQQSPIPSPVERHEHLPYNPTYAFSPRRPSPPPQPRDTQTPGRFPQPGYPNGFHSRQSSLNDGARPSDRIWMDNKIHNEGRSFLYQFLLFFRSSGWPTYGVRIPTTWKQCPWKTRNLDLASIPLFSKNSILYLQSFSAIAILALKLILEVYTNHTQHTWMVTRKPSNYVFSPFWQTRLAKDWPFGGIIESIRSSPGREDAKDD